MPRKGGPLMGHSEPLLAKNGPGESTDSSGQFEGLSAFPFLNKTHTASRSRVAVSVSSQRETDGAKKFHELQ